MEISGQPRKPGSSSGLPPPQQRPKCKIIFLGSPGTGKTSLINRFMYDEFNRDYETTVGVDYFTKTITVGDGTVSLQIWDTAGQERFGGLTKNYLRDTQVAIIVYDVSDERGFVAAQEWFEFLANEREQNVKCILAGNKVDLPKAVDEPVILRFVDRNDIQKVDVSAKTGENVVELFQMVLRAVAEMEIAQQSPDLVDVRGDGPRPSRRCC